MKFRYWAAGVTLALVACTSLPYKNDNGFLVSAQANSPEFPVYLNGHLCTDMEGFVGLCSKRIKSTEDITFRFDPQTYAYLLTVNCTQGVTPVAAATVPQSQPYSFVLKAADFSQFTAFTCVGEVSPQDRTPPISARFRVSFSVVDAQYSARERIYPTTSDGKNYLVLGEFARSAWVYDQGKWAHHDQDTTVEIKGDPSQVKAYSESYAMRFNYFNLGDADAGTNPVASITQY